jgi:hypothetical protein
MSHYFPTKAIAVSIALQEIGIRVHPHDLIKCAERVGMPLPIRSQRVGEQTGYIVPPEQYEKLRGVVSQLGLV